MTSDYNKLISRASLTALAGYILSGPVGFMIAKLVKAQPTWSSSAVFAENYHITQDIPYYFGFLLIGGMLALALGHFLRQNEEQGVDKFDTMMSLALTIVFSSIILFNYVSQTTFVRHLALGFRPEYSIAIATFSMANPQSVGWSIEMWGYGVLGVANWFLFGYYQKRSNSIRILLMANGVMSLLGVVLTVVNMSWLMTVYGLAAYIAWNALMMITMILIYRFSLRNQKKVY